MSREALESYKNILRRMDVYHARGEEHPDELEDGLYLASEYMTAEDRKEAIVYVYELRRAWPATIRYAEAVDVLTRNPSHPHVWERRRDEAWAGMTDAERAHYGG